MAARIEEHDFGTKRATRKKLDQLIREHPSKFDAAVFAWWQKVYQTALFECPIGTEATTGKRGYVGGSLRSTIRIQKGEDNSDTYDVGRSAQGVNTEYYIIAGGSGVINPNWGREVDYAQAIHDGYIRGTTVVPPNPFLDRALQQHQATMDEDIAKYLDWYEKEWAADQPSVPPRWSLPMKFP